jgi:Tol biopolymer transport system component
MSNSDAQFFMIHLGAIDGSWTRVLAPDGEEDLAWSPDSTQIAYSVLSGRRGVLSPGYLCSKVSSSEIMTIGIDGSNMTYVLEQPGVWRVRDWSPDGKKLLLWHEMTEVRSENTVEAVGEVVEYALARALASRKKPVSGILGRGDKEPTMGARYLKPLVFGTATFAPQSARYSPDGKQIAFVYVDPTRPGEIVRVRDIVRWHCWGKLAICDIATGTIRTIADPPGGIWTGPICWSPDGQEILITRYLAAEDEREKSEGSPSMGIWAVTADGKKERFITTGWSPDWR